MKNLFIFVSVLILFSGCSQLSPGGARINLIEDVTGEKINNMVKVGSVNCRNEAYFTTKSVNKRLCTERLKNQAYELGAEAITVDQLVDLPGFLNTGVEMLGTAYKRSR